MLQAVSRHRTVAVGLGTTRSVISRLWTHYPIMGSVAERHGRRSRITIRRLEPYVQIYILHIYEYL